jgi:hypothetical protein
VVHPRPRRLPGGAPAELGQAQRIILADPARYERILHTLKEPPQPG